MRKSTKLLVIYLIALGLSVAMAMQLAQAEQTYQIEVVEDGFVVAEEALDQAELTAILAPIALYPDSLLSHIFIASTLPLEVIQAARWSTQNTTLTAQQALDAVEEKAWDPSVKALVAFPDLLQRMNQDLDWLAAVGDAFSHSESQLLQSVQLLREQAYARGNLRDNDYIQVVEEDQQIIIQPVQEEVIYLPYYDTRVIYGDWWHHHQPHYWHRPTNYFWYAGLYWSPRIYVRPYYFDFGRVHWRNRHVTINHPYHYKYYKNKRYSSVHKGYVHWRKHDKYNKRSNRQYVRSREQQRSKVDHRRVKKSLASHQQHRYAADNVKRVQVVKSTSQRRVSKLATEQSQVKSKGFKQTNTASSHNSKKKANHAESAKKQQTYRSHNTQRQAQYANTSSKQKRNSTATDRQRSDRQPRQRIAKVSSDKRLYQHK